MMPATPNGSTHVSEPSTTKPPRQRGATTAPPEAASTPRAGMVGVVKDVASEVVSDDIAGESAKAAYYFFLSLFPAILALFAFTGIVGGERAFTDIMASLRAAMPGEAATYLERFVQEITDRQRPGMLSLGLILSLWSGSNIFATLSVGLNVVYDLDESRPWVRRRAISVLALTVSLGLFAGGTAAIIAGPSIVVWLELPAVWNALRWPLAFVLVTAMIWLVYYLLPNRNQRGALKPTLIGAMLGASLWVVATLVLRLYVTHFGSFSKTYGVIGGIMLLLLWLYLTAFSILVGGELAATLEQRAAGTVGVAAGADR